MLDHAETVMVGMAIAGVAFLVVMFSGMAMLVRRGYMPDVKLSRRAKFLLAAFVLATLLIPLLRAYLLNR